MNGLPAFFQTQGTTVLDELTSFELADGNGSNDAPQSLQFGSQQKQTTAETVDDDAFGDLKDDNLPDFFRSSASTAETEAILAGLSIGGPTNNSSSNNSKNPNITPVSYKTAFLPPGLQPQQGAQSQQQQLQAPRTMNVQPLTLADLQKQQQQQQQHPSSAQDSNQPYYATATTAAAPQQTPVAAAPGLRPTRGPPALPGLFGPSAHARSAAPDTTINPAQSAPPQVAPPQQPTPTATGAAGAGAAGGVKPVSYAAALAPAAAQPPTPAQQQQPQQQRGLSQQGRSQHQPSQQSREFPSAGRGLFNANYPPPQQIRTTAAAGVGGIGGGAVPPTELGISPQSALFSAKMPLFFRPGKGFAAPTGAAPPAASIAAGASTMPFFSGSNTGASGAGTSTSTAGDGGSEEHSADTRSTRRPRDTSGRGGGGERMSKAVPRGKFMSPSDVRFVVNRVMQPLESNDPFSDDFYFLQLSIKKNSAARETAMRENSPEMPPMIYVPLPTWKDTKERIRMQMEMTRKSFMQRSREWEQKEQVLGHMVRHDASKPKAQLAIPLLSELDFDLNDADAEFDEELSDGSLRTPFSSRLWSMRLAVQRGYEALYTVQELHHLMSSPLIGTNPAASAEIQREIQNAVALLSQSVGIRAGAAAAGGGGGATVLGASGDFSLDGGHVGAILQTNIGKKLIARSLKLLTPAHRWAMLPVILAKTLLAQQQQKPLVTGTDSGTAATATATETQLVEQRLLKAIIEFLQYSYQFQIEQQNACPPGISAEFTNIFLANLRQCIKSVMVTQMEKEKLIQTLISERTRAEVMHLIVQIGDKVCATAQAQLSEEWVQTREAFISMLDN